MDAPTRRVLNADQLVNTVRATFGDALVVSLHSNFGGMSFPEQVCAPELNAAR